MCLYPTFIRNPKYKPNKKNGGNIPAVSDTRVLHTPIGCGKCIECMKQNARQWHVRLSEDIKHHKEALFVALTFDQHQLIKLSENFPDLKGYAMDNAIATLAVRRFLERWRKKYKVSLRHFLVTELGHKNTEHIHLHGILYTNNREDIRKIWGYGFVWTGYNQNEKIVNYVNQATVNYITKYITKVDIKHKHYKPIVLCSPGIGKDFVNNYNTKDYKFKGEESKEYYRTESGHKLNLPIYYRNKFYTDEEREKLWIQRLDKQERFICGERIDLTKPNNQYYETLEHYRKLNSQLGYMDNKRNWKREQYENIRRELIRNYIKENVNNNNNKK